MHSTRVHFIQNTLIINHNKFPQFPGMIQTKSTTTYTPYLTSSTAPARIPHKPLDSKHTDFSSCNLFSQTSLNLSRHEHHIRTPLQNHLTQLSSLPTKHSNLTNNTAHFQTFKYLKYQISAVLHFINLNIFSVAFSTPQDTPYQKISPFFHPYSIFRYHRFFLFINFLCL